MEIGQPIQTPQEAAVKAGLSARFPLCNLTDLYQTELEEFRVCLGMALYEKMRSLVVNYSAVGNWSQGVTYPTGQKVRNGGEFWIALQATNSEPVVENEYWALAPKFDETTTCGQLYNNLWCTFLSRHLALKSAILTTGRNAVDITAAGVVRRTGNGIIPADAKEIEHLQRSFQHQSEQVYGNMMAWIAAQKAANPDCFPKDECANVCEDVCDPCENGGCTSEKSRLYGVSAY